MSIHAVRQILNDNGISFFNLRGHEIGTLTLDIDSQVEEPDFTVDNLREALQRANLRVDDIDLSKILAELKISSEAEAAELQRDASVSSLRAKYREVHDYNGFILPKLDHAENKTLRFFEERFTASQIEWMQAAGSVNDFRCSLYNLGQYLIVKLQQVGDVIFDPTNQAFNIPAFYLMKFEAPTSNLIEEMSASGKIRTENVINWIDNVAAHLPNGRESLNINPSLLENEYIVPKDFIPLYLGVMQEVLLSVGIHRTTTDSGESLGFVHQDLTEELTTEAGRKIPLYYISNLAGSSGNASAWVNHVTISADSLISLEIANREYALWYDLTQSHEIEWPSFIENPYAIRPWIYMMVYGSKNLPQALELDKQERLNEEKWHSDFAAYGIASVGRNIVFSPYMKDETIAWAESMLQSSQGDGELLIDEMNALPDTDSKFKFALDLCEIQTLIASLSTSTCPAITLCRLITGTVLPFENSGYYPPGTNSINSYLTRLLSKNLLGHKTVAPEEWQEFLEKRMRTEGSIKEFNEKIKHPAKKTYRRHFLTLQDMDKRLPVWKERAEELTKLISVKQ